MDNIIGELYNRQEDLIESCHEKTAMVIGVGGIGSWVAIDLALLGIGTLILIDPDKIESSNLNRTLFRLQDIGKYKTKIAEELISERRCDCLVLTFEEHFSPEHLKKYPVDYIFDCTDTLYVRNQIKDIIPEETHYCKCGYDGLECSISLNDFDSGIWGEDPGSYTIIPSFFGSPQVIAGLAVTEMFFDNFKIEKKTWGFHLKKLLEAFSGKETQEIGKEEQ
jgi:hypothetical protein